MLQLIKVDRQLHFATMSIELASVCITHWIKKFYVFVYQFISSIFKMFIVKQTDNNGRFRWNIIVMDQPK